MKRLASLIAPLALLAACDRPTPAPAPPAPVVPPKTAPAAPVAAAAVSPSVGAPPPPVGPPAPGTPGGLPDDGTPVSEAPFTPDSAQGAANVVQTYFALIEEKKYRRAYRLWADGGRASGADEGGFTAGFKAYGDYHAQIGAPFDSEGAAGSIYIKVPIVTYGRLIDGAPFSRRRTVTLRRVNDVPGSSAEQRRWHIAGIETLARAPSPPPS